MVEKGLTSQEAQQKLAAFGKNEISAEETTNYFKLFISQFPTLINIVLAGASILSLIIGSFIDAALILIILFLNAIFGFVQEYRAEKSLDKLKTYIKSVVRVIRDGKEMQISATELVPGDTVILSEGDRIPADGQLIANKILEIDESVLTGESLPVVKNHNDQVFLGTLITRGGNHLLVGQTGIHTRFGQIAKTLGSISSDKTPLEKHLDSLAKTLSIIVIATAFLIIPLGIVQGKEFIPLTLLAVSIGIAAIPEGLPAVVTIALALGTGKMAKKKAIVRKMNSVETLGAIQVILTDKTGTLTQNIMRVKKHWVCKEEYFQTLLKTCVFGNTASLIEKADQNSFDVVGDKTDGALLIFARKESTDNQDYKTQGAIIEEYPFDSEIQTVTTIWQNNSHNETKHIFVRGAPEAVLAKSKLPYNDKNEITKKFEEYAREGLRVIGFAAKTSNHSEAITREDAEKDLTFLGIVGIYDPPRIEAKKAVEQARNAGINTIMLTGDNALTAETIAKEIGLLEKDDDIATGEEIEKLSDDELQKLILKIRIFARVMPEDKLRIVSLFKKLGYIVAVTGDGVNDALALKRADVGIAMGENGTDVAKEAADIVLTDDNFFTLVKAIEEGRRIYDNILKAITYLLSGNLSEIGFVFLASIIGLPNPLLPTQILWINLVTDGIPALALASDRKDPDILKRKPRDSNAPILSNHRLIFIAAVGISLSVIFLLTFKITLGFGGSETLARTIVFNVLVASHMTIAFLIRGKSMLKMNKFLVGGILLTIILQIIISTTPFFQNIFKLGF